MIPLPINFSGAHYSSLPLRTRDQGEASLPAQDANVKEKEAAEIALGKIRSIIDDKTLFQQDAGPTLTGAASSAIDVSNDCSAIGRTFPELNPSSCGQYTHLYPIMGISTAFSSVMGSVAANQAKERYERMGSVGATAQKTDAAIDYVRGLAQAGGGISFAANRPLSIGSTITNASSSSLLGRATLYTGSIGGAFFGVLYASFSAIFSRKIFRLSKFENKMYQNGSVDNEVAKFLIVKRLKEKTPQETLNKLILSSNNDIEKVKPILQKKALSAVEKFYSSLVKDAAKNGIDTHGIVKGKGKTYAANVFKALNDDPNVMASILKSMELSDCKEAKQLSPQELIGLELMCKARNQKKEIKLSECIGPKATALAKDAIETKLIEGLDSEDPVIQKAAQEDAQKLVSEAKKGIQSNKRMNWAVLCTCVLGVLSTVASFLPLVGIAFAVEQMVNLGIYLSMLIMDWTGLKSAQQVESGPIGKHDKTILGIHTALCVSAIAATIVVGSIFSMGILPIAAAGTIGAIWLANNIVAYVKLIQKERAYKIAHPTLSDVKEVLTKLPNQNGKLDETTKLLFKRLSTSDKKAVKNHFLENGSTDERTLSPEDKPLDENHRFGENFSYKYPKDPTVLCAAEKAFQKTRSLAIRGLIALLGNDSTEEDVKEYIDKLSEEDKKNLFQHVYNKRARKKSSIAFENATVEKISTAIKETQMSNEKAYKDKLKEQLEQLKNFLV